MTKKACCIRVSEITHNQIKGRGAFGQTYDDIIQELLNDSLDEGTKSKLEHYKDDDQTYNDVINDLMKLVNEFSKKYMV